MVDRISNFVENITLRVSNAEAGVEQEQPALEQDEQNPARQVQR